MTLRLCLALAGAALLLPPPLFAQETRDLPPGLQLIGIPTPGPGTDSCFGLLGALGGPGAVSRIARLDAATQSEEECGFAGGVPSGIDFPVRANEGYYARLLSPVSVSQAPAASCEALDLRPGVNLIAVAAPVTGLSCTRLLERLGADLAATLERLDAAVGSFDACGFADGGGAPVGRNFPLVPGEGYALHMRQAVSGFDPCPLPDLPPRFVSGAPASLSVQEGQALIHTIEARDPEDVIVDLESSGVPFGRARTLTGRFFEIQFEPGFEDAGEYSVDVQIADSALQVQNETLSLSVENANRAPSLLPLEPPRIFLRVEEEGTLEFRVKAEDADLADPAFPDTIAFALETPVENLEGPFIDAGTPDEALFRFTPDLTQAGRYDVLVSVEDAAGERSELLYRIEVTNENRRPSLALIQPAAPAAPHLLNVGQTQDLIFEATDPDGDPIEIGLLGDIALDEAFSGPALDTLRYLEGRGLIEVSSRVESSPSPVPGSPSTARLIVSIEPITFFSPLPGQDQAFSVAVRASDGEEFSPTVALEVAPRGLRVNSDDFTPPGVARLFLNAEGTELGAAVPIQGLNLGGAAIASVDLPAPFRLGVVSLGAVSGLIGILGPPGSLPQQIVATVHMDSGDQFPLPVYLVEQSSDFSVPAPRVESVDGRPFVAGQTYEVGDIVTLRARIDMSRRFFPLFPTSSRFLRLIGNKFSGNFDGNDLVAEWRLQVSPGATEIEVQTSGQSGITRRTETILVDFQGLGISAPAAPRLARVAHRPEGPYLEFLPGVDPPIYLLPRGEDLLEQSTGPENPFVFYYVFPKNGVTEVDLELTMASDEDDFLTGPAPQTPVHTFPMQAATLPLLVDGVERTDYLVSPPLLMAFRSSPAASLDPFIDLPGSGIGISIGATEDFLIEPNLRAAEGFPAPGPIRAAIRDNLRARAIVPGTPGRTVGFFEADKFFGNLGRTGLSPFAPGFAVGSTQIPLAYSVTRDIPTPTAHYPFPTFEGLPDPFQVLVEQDPDDPPNPDGAQIGVNRAFLSTDQVAGVTDYGPVIDARFLVYSAETAHFIDYREGLAGVIELIPGTPLEFERNHVAIQFSPSATDSPFRDSTLSRFLRERELGPIGIFLDDRIVIGNASSLLSDAELMETLIEVTAAFLVEDASLHLRGTVRVNATEQRIPLGNAFDQAAPNSLLAGFHQVGVAQRFGAKAIPDYPSGRFAPVGATAHLHLMGTFAAHALEDHVIRLAGKDPDSFIAPEVLAVVDTGFGGPFHTGGGTFFHANSGIDLQRIIQPTILTEFGGSLIGDDGKLFTVLPGGRFVNVTDPVEAPGSDGHGTGVLANAAGDGRTSPSPEVRPILGTSRHATIRPFAIGRNGGFFDLEEPFQLIQDDPEVPYRVVQISIDMPWFFNPLGDNVEDVVEKGVIVVSANAYDDEAPFAANELSDRSPQSLAPSLPRGGSPETDLFLVVSAYAIDRFPEAVRPADLVLNDTDGGQAHYFGNVSVSAPWGDFFETASANVNERAGVLVTGGTSLAAPLVSGILAQMSVIESLLGSPPLSSGPFFGGRAGLAPLDLVEILLSTADPLNSGDGRVRISDTETKPQAKVWGTGGANHWKALLTQLNGGPPAEVASHLALNFPSIATRPVSEIDTRYYGLELRSSVQNAVIDLVDSPGQEPGSDDQVVTATGRDRPKLNTDPLDPSSPLLDRVAGFLGVEPVTMFKPDATGKLTRFVRDRAVPWGADKLVNRPARPGAVRSDFLLRASLQAGDFRNHELQVRDPRNPSPVQYAVDLSHIDEIREMMENGNTLFFDDYVLRIEVPQLEVSTITAPIPVGGHAQILVRLRHRNGSPIEGAQYSIDAPAVQFEVIQLPVAPMGHQAHFVIGRKSLGTFTVKLNVQLPSGFERMEAEIPLP